MLDLQLPALDPARGTRLDDDYRHDFRRRAAEIRDGSSWKLERLQHFEETSPSREALRRGDWAGAWNCWRSAGNNWRRPSASGGSAAMSSTASGWSNSP